MNLATKKVCCELFICCYSTITSYLLDLTLFELGQRKFGFKRNSRELNIVDVLPSSCDLYGTDLFCANPMYRYMYL